MLGGGGGGLSEGAVRREVGVLTEGLEVVRRVTVVESWMEGRRWAVQVKIEDPALAGGSVAAVVLELEVGLGLDSVRGERYIGPDEETEMERADVFDTVQKVVFDVGIVAGIDH